MQSQKYPSLREAWLAKQSFASSPSRQRGDAINNALALRRIGKNIITTFYQYRLILSFLDDEISPMLLFVHIATFYRVIVNIFYNSYDPSDDSIGLI